MSSHCAESTMQPNLRQEAANLLIEQGLLSLVERWGKVFVGGSYFYDLMGWRDLDIYISTPQR